MKQLCKAQSVDEMMWASRLKARLIVETTGTRIKFSTRLHSRYLDRLARLAYWKRTNQADELEAALYAYFTAQNPANFDPIPPKKNRA